MQIYAKDNKIIELKEKNEEMSAWTAAVGLASASLAAKGKDTLDQLEDTREELRWVQGSWSGEQLEWRREIWRERRRG